MTRKYVDELPFRPGGGKCEVYVQERPDALFSRMAGKTAARKELMK